MKVAILIFCGLVAMCIGYGPFVMSGKLSEQERKRKQRGEKNQHSR